MTTTLLTAAQLTPLFSIQSTLSAPISSDSLLIGQERVIDAFRLLRDVDGQQMYLADFQGLDRKLFIQALATSSELPASQYLAATKSNSQDIELVWQQALVPEHVGVIAEKNTCYQYLSGNLRRHDFIGRMRTKGNTSEYQPGALASSHYVFVCAESLWKRESLWDFLIQILSLGSYRINDELPKIPLNCKIILVGNSQLYSQLYQLESPFLEHFPLLAEVASEIDLVHFKEIDYQTWVSALAKSMSLTLSNNCFSPLFKYSARLTEHQTKLSLASLHFVQLLAQSQAYANTNILDASHINHAIAQQTLRHNSQEIISSQNFDDKFISLATSGEVIGQVNGLTVIDLADYAYGEPARITASVHYGDGEVADIERKSELGGNIHAKGMMILSSCLYRIFSKDAPLHLNANIVFEQSYQEIDGDSASLAEYCCLMSAIAEHPIQQSLAVTGAIDQFGNVQAIGGVNEKINGFFRLCERRGLTGTQGIIIPKANTLQLNLGINIIQAVEKGLFHLYQVEHIDEAVELLMQLPAGVADEDNQFADDTLYGMVQARLDRLAGQVEDEELNIFAKLLTKFRFFSK